MRGRNQGGIKCVGGRVAAALVAGSAAALVAELGARRAAGIGLQSTILTGCGERRKRGKKGQPNPWLLVR